MASIPSTATDVEKPEKPQTSDSNNSASIQNIQYEEPSAFRASEEPIERKRKKWKFWKKYREGEKRYAKRVADPFCQFISGFRLRKLFFFSCDSQLTDTSHWWFASTGIPLLAASLGPLANVLSIAALVSYWRSYVYIDGQFVRDFDGVPFKDPRW